MVKCLVTKLDVSVNNPSLKGFGEIVYTYNLPESTAYYAQPFRVVEARKSEWKAYDENWKPKASGVLDGSNVTIYNTYKYLVITNYYNLKNFGTDRDTKDFNFKDATYCLQVEEVDLGWGTKEWDITINDFAELSIKNGRDYSIAPTCTISASGGTKYKNQDGDIITLTTRTNVIVNFLANGYTITIGGKIVYNSGL